MSAIRYPEPPAWQAVPEVSIAPDDNYFKLKVLQLNDGRTLEGLGYLEGSFGLHSTVSAPFS